jgi:hypothetical protein
VLALVLTQLLCPSDEFADAVRHSSFMNDVHNMDIEEHFKHKSLMTAEAKSLFEDVKV